MTFHCVFLPAGSAWALYTHTDKRRKKARTLFLQGLTLSYRSDNKTSSLDHMEWVGCESNSALCCIDKDKNHIYHSLRATQLPCNCRETKHSQGLSCVNPQTCNWRETKHSQNLMQCSLCPCITMRNLTKCHTPANMVSTVQGLQRTFHTRQNPLYSYKIYAWKFNKILALKCKNINKSTLS